MSGWPKDLALLPASLRHAWAGEPLPDCLLKRAGLPEKVTLGDLDARFNHDMVHVPSDFPKYLSKLVSSRRRGIRNLPALQRGWPAGVDPSVVPWRFRTRTCLKNAGMSNDLQRLSRVTFGELFQVKNMGVLSVLDFASAVESMDPGRSSGGPPTPEPPTRNPPELDEASRQVLLKAMDAPWADAVSARDPRFAGTLLNPDGTIAQQLDRIFDADTFRTGSFEAAAALAGSLPAIEEKARAIDILPLDLAVRQLISAISRTRGVRLEALLARLGFGADPPITLQEAADRIGVSRERFRQIQEDLPNRLPPHQVLMPALDRALALLARIAPVSAEVAAARLVEEGISTIPFHPLNVLAAAQLCRRLPTFRVQELKQSQVVVSTNVLASAQKILDIASRRARFSGATNLADLSVALSCDGLDVPEGDLRGLLVNLGGALFIKDDWFLVPAVPETNRLYSVTRAILSVTNPISVQSVRDGARRRFRHRGKRREVAFVPPRSVIVEALRKFRCFHVDSAGEVVSSREELDYRTELSHLDRLAVEIFKDSGSNILDRRSLSLAAEARGISSNYMNLAIAYSPVLDRLSPGVWSLRGTLIEPAALQAFLHANADRPREQRVLGHGWADDGKLWLAIRIPAAWGTLSIGIPAAISRLVAGKRFSARSEDGTVAGTIAVSDAGGSWGYLPFLNRSGADEGDILLVTFDLMQEEATLALTTDEGLEDLPGT